MCVHACCFSLSTYALFVCLHAGCKGWAWICHRSRWIHDVRPDWSSRTKRSQGYIYFRDPDHFPHFLSLTKDVWCMYVLQDSSISINILFWNKSWTWLWKHFQWKCTSQCKCIFVCREIVVYLDLLEFQWVFWAKKAKHFTSQVL